jgi:hypothetical protein
MTKAFRNILNRDSSDECKYLCTASFRKSSRFPKLRLRHCFATVTVLHVLSHVLEYYQCGFSAEISITAGSDLSDVVTFVLSSTHPGQLAESHHFIPHFIWKTENLNEDIQSSTLRVGLACT